MSAKEIILFLVIFIGASVFVGIVTALAQNGQLAKELTVCKLLVISAIVGTVTGVFFAVSWTVYWATAKLFLT